MRKACRVFTYSVLTLVVTACEKPPKRSVCEHLSHLIQEQETVRTGALRPADCEVEVERRRAEDPEEFQRLESCILATRSLDAASLCGF